VIKTLYTLGAAKLAAFALLARRGDGTIVEAPLVLHARERSARERGDAADVNVLPIVSWTKEHLIVWSLSGRAGSRQQPLVEQRPPYQLDAAATKLQTAARDRPADEHGLVVMLDSDLTVERVFDVMGAFRIAPDGGELFPDVLLYTLSE
jgi:hypothetical protein